MSLFVQCFIACAIFSALVLPAIFKNPISMLTSYPPAIRKRVESLPQYQDVTTQIKKKHIIKKIIAGIICTFIFAMISYFSGARTFQSAFSHVFILFFVVNMFDVFVIDLMICCHSKKVIIEGTEDMIDEYRKPWYHLIAGVYGTIIGLIVALLSGFYVHLFINF